MIRHLRRTRLGATLVALPLLASDSLAQDAPPRALPAPTVELEESMSSIVGLIELADGRLLVSDRKEGLIRLVDLANGRVSTVSRQGRGPTEFLSPGGFYRQRNGDIWMIDQTQRRYLVFTSSGRPTTTAPYAQNSGALVMSGSNDDPHALDERGAEYVRPMPARRPSEASDSGWAIRRVGERTDSLVRLRLPETSVNTTQGASITAVKRFAPTDGFVAALDGRYAVVRAAPYRVEWWKDGKRLAQGPEVAYTPVRTTEADRAEAEKARAQISMPGNLRITQNDAQGNTRTVDPRGLIPPVAIADVKPAFDPSQLRVDTQGRLWVRRHTPQSEEHVYDVFDAEGRRIDRVLLPRASRLVGFGRGAVYVARADEDDLLYLGKLTY